MARFRRGRRRRRVRRRSVRRRRGRRRRLVMDPERKVMTDVNPGILSNSTLFVQLLNDTTQGVGNNARIGIQHINLSSLFTATININTGILPLSLKFWLIHDKQPRGALMAAGDLLHTVAQPVTSARSLEETLRLRVLWTRTVQLDVFNPIKRVKMFKRLMFKSRWDGPFGGIANLQSGSLLLAFASTIPAGGVLPRITFSHRLRFVG